jgi:hypothetical protein
MTFRSDAYEQTLSKKLKIGYLCYKDQSGKTVYGLENLPVSKGTSRAIKMTLDKLETLGHSLVPFEVTQAEFREMEQVYIGFANVASIPNLAAHSKKRYERLLPFYNLFILVASLPTFLLSFVIWILEKCTSEHRLVNRARSMKTLNHEGVNGLY